MLIETYLDDYNKVYGQNPLNIYFYYANYILYALGIILALVIAIQSLKKAKNSDNKIQNAFNTSIGWFFIFMFISLVIFFVDRLHIFFMDGERWLQAQDTSITLIEYDYMYLAIALNAIGIVILYYPVERYIQQKESFLLTKITGLTTLLFVVVRYLENTFGMIGSYIGFGIPILAFAFCFLSFLFQYIKLGIKSPKGSDMRKRAFSIVLGFLLFLVGVTISTNLSKSTYDVFGQSDLHILAPLGPLIFIIGAFMLWKSWGVSE
jgi:hypothetical protein